MADPTSGEGRRRKPPTWMQEYVSGENLSEEEEEGLENFVMFTLINDPSCFEEAIVENRWREVKDQEIDSIERNETWELCSLPAGANTIGVKWIFKTKLNENGEIDKCKARLVSKGYAQKYGVDYT